jgi:hypothetical protein
MTDWYGNGVERNAVDRALVSARYQRVTGEITDPRQAAGLMDITDPLARETAAFLATQAPLLERENESCIGIELSWRTDTRENAEELPSAARSALLIARAYLASRRSSVA